MGKTKEASSLIWIAVIGLVSAIVILETQTLDFWFQDHFFQQGRWLIDENAPLGRLLFYSGLKSLLLAVGAFALIAFAWKRIVQRITDWNLCYFLLGLMLIPLLTSLLKWGTGVFCPNELTRYGGSFQHSSPFACRLTSSTCGRCFPGGHASGGFAFLSLILLRPLRENSLKPYIPGLLFGWTMGIYQMLKGAHFLSHTLATQFLALLVVGLLQVSKSRLIPPKN